MNTGRVKKGGAAQVRLTRVNREMTAHILRGAGQRTLFRQRFPRADITYAFNFILLVFLGASPELNIKSRCTSDKG